MERRNQEQEDYREIPRKKGLVVGIATSRISSETLLRYVDEDEVIPMICPELPIKTDAFDWDEYQRAKRAVKEGKKFWRR